MDKFRFLVKSYIHPTMKYRIWPPKTNTKVLSKPFSKAIQIWAYDKGELIGVFSFSTIYQCVYTLKNLDITKSFGPLINTGKLFKKRYTFCSKYFHLE